jgi:hypothetical protein
MLAVGNRGQLIVLPSADHAFAIIGYGPDRSVARTLVEIDRYLATLGWPDGRPLLQSSEMSK